jgi:hypothetical protein
VRAKTDDKQGGEEGKHGYDKGKQETDNHETKGWGSGSGGHSQGFKVNKGVKARLRAILQARARHQGRSLEDIQSEAVAEAEKKGITLQQLLEGKATARGKGGLAPFKFQPKAPPASKATKGEKAPAGAAKLKLEDDQAAEESGLSGH